MELGVFLPTATNGYVMSSNSPQFQPTYELNRDITLLAENLGFEFVLSMIKLRGFDGASGYWEQNLESLTLMGAPAAVTKDIRLIGSVAVLTLPPAFAARMAVTVDQISNGRFGLNIVSGWQYAEYSQMGLWPGEQHYARRYEYCAEYVTILRELWGTGRSDFKGEYFKMDDCRLAPQPPKMLSVVCAGQSDKGTRFASQYGDYNFCSSIGINHPDKVAPSVARLLAENEKTGRDVGALVSVMIIAEESDDAAMAKWNYYMAGTDTLTLSNRAQLASADPNTDPYSTPHRSKLGGDGPKPVNGGLLVGSYARVAEMLDVVGQTPGVRGAVLTFDDFLPGLVKFGSHIQPLMTTRRHVPN